VLLFQHAINIESSVFFRSMDLHESAVTDTGSDTGKDDNAVDQSVSCADGEAADDFEESEVEHAPTLTAPAMVCLFLPDVC